MFQSKSMSKLPHHGHAMPFISRFPYHGCRCVSVRCTCVGYADSKDLTHDVFIPARARRFWTGWNVCVQLLMTRITPDPNFSDSVFLLAAELHCMSVLLCIQTKYHQYNHLYSSVDLDLFVSGTWINICNMCCGKIVYPLFPPPDKDLKTKRL